MNNQEIKNFELSQLHPHKTNVRRDIGDVSEIADSIREHGIVEPLIVRPHKDRDGDYEILMGHRRFVAAREAGKLTVPCVVREDITSDADAIQAMLIENVQRADITKSDEGRAYQGLLDLGMSINQIAKRVGRKHETVDSRLKLNSLSPKAQDKVDQGLVTLERAAQVAEFADDPETANKLEAVIDSWNFDFEYRDAVAKREWEAWSPLALENMSKIGFQVLNNDEAKDRSKERITNYELRETFPSDAKQVATMEDTDFPEEVLENIDGYAVAASQTQRKVVWFYAGAGTEDESPELSPEEEQRAQEKELIETGLRTARAQFVDFVRDIVLKPQKIRGAALELLVREMSMGGRAFNYASVLGIDVEEPQEWSERAEASSKLADAFRKFSLDQLMLAQFIVEIGADDSELEARRAGTLFEMGTFAHAGGSNYLKSIQGQRRVAVELLGWHETPAERMAREFWEPTLPGTEGANEKDEVNF